MTAIRGRRFFTGIMIPIIPELHEHDVAPMLRVAICSRRSSGWSLAHLTITSV